MPTPSIRMCRKRKIGIENMFVDNDGVLPHNHRIPTGSGKIAAVGQVETIQSLHLKDGTKDPFFQVFRTEDPYTHACVLGTRPVSEDRKRDVERVLHDLSGVVQMIK